MIHKAVVMAEKAELKRARQEMLMAKKV